MAIGKALRFEIFARDGFVCQYCGQRPPDVILEIDHIQPKSKDGSDDPINLITACYDYNRGKRDKVLNQIAPRPDADLAFLKAQQEIVEVERFLAAKKKQDELNNVLVDSLQDVWSKYLTEDDVPTKKVLIPWISKYGADEVAESIAAASPALLRGQFGYGDPFWKLLKYVGAILRNRQNRALGLPDKGEKHGDH